MHKKERIAIAQFSAHWSQYSDLQPYHEKWLTKYISYSTYRRGECFYDSNWEEERIFYISSGLIGRIVQTAVPAKPSKKDRSAADQEEESEEREKTAPQIKRSILSVGLPSMALMTTDHLYSSTQSTGEIVALRPSEILTIDYGAIKNFIRDDQSLDKMLYALSNKKKRQLTRLRQLNAITDPQSVYLKFVETLPELHRSLSQIEQQDLLGISRSSIQRASYFRIMGKKA